MAKRSAVLALVMLAGACARTPEPAAPLPAPEPIPPIASPPPPTPPPPPATEPRTVCVVRNDELSYVTASVDPATGDSTYEGRRFRDAFPADSTYAASAAWYHRNEPIAFNGRRYVSYGLPRALRPGDLVARGQFRGTTIFVATADTDPQMLIIYVPVRPTCEFQPYETEGGWPVRGG